MKQLGETHKARDEILKMRMAVLERVNTLKQFETQEIQIAVRGGKNLLDGGEFAGIVAKGEPAGPGITLMNSFTIRKGDVLLPKLDDPLSAAQRLEMIKRFEQWKADEDRKRLKELEDALMRKMKDAEQKRQEEMEAKRRADELAAANAAAEAAKAKITAEKAARAAAKAEADAMREGNRVASRLAQERMRFKAEGGPYRMPAGVGGVN